MCHYKGVFMKKAIPKWKDWFAPMCLVLVAFSLTACQPRFDPNAAPLRSGFTCCNLRYEGDWISDGNYGENPFIPAGTAAKVFDYGSDRAYAEIGGRRVRLGHDYGRAEESLQQWVAKIIVVEDPKKRLASYPTEVREAIRIGKVMEGMTKEQVIMAVGYPMTSETLSLDASVWNYWMSSFDQYQVIWDKQGRAKVSADPGVKARAVYLPER